MTQYFLAKSEPSVYSWDRFVADGRTGWDGVRNFEARNNLRSMKTGDLVLYYHSNEDKAVVGVARVVREAYPDRTAKNGDWSSVDLEPVKALTRPVSLAEMKTDAALADFALLKKSRLSVVPASAAHFKRILSLGKTKL